MLQLSLVIRRDHTILRTPILLMVSLCGADQAVGVDMLVLPALVTLLLKWAVSLNVIVFPTVLAGAFKLPERDRGGVSLDGRASAIISRALRGNKSDSIA